MLKPRLVLVPALVAASVFFGVGGFGQLPGRGSGFTTGQPATGQPGVSRSTAEIMAEQTARGPRQFTFIKREFEIPGREHRQQDPAARFDPQIAPGAAKKGSTSASGEIASPNFSQTAGLQWDGVTGPRDTNSFPPDSMGMAGPSQFIIFVNGRLRSFNKATGVADGVLDMDPDVFFSSVMTPLTGG